MRSLAIAAAITCGSGSAVGAAQSAGPVPVIERTADGSIAVPLQAPAGHQLIVTEAEFTPSQEIKPHRHLGTEIALIISGETEFQSEGERARTLRGGESVVIKPGTYHRAKAGPHGAKLLIVRVHPVGQPLRILPDRPVRFPG